MSDPRSPERAEYVPEAEAFLGSRYGARRRGWRGRRIGFLTDPLYDLRLARNQSYRSLERNAASMPLRRVHIAAVDVPARRADLDRVIAALSETRHDVSVSLAPLGDRGKFENINLALRDVALAETDWLIVTDDDVAFPKHFLDRFLFACEAASLRIAQPAHCFQSHTAWEVTQRIWNSLVHTTHFVECGPLTAFHRSVLPHVVPFPETRWAWGVDVVWGEIARREGFRIGVVDATPIRHLRPVGKSYNQHSAVEEARQLLAAHRIQRSSKAIFQTTAVLSQL